MSIDFSKPIEAAEGFNRTEAEVLKIRVDGRAIIYWRSGGNDCFGSFPAHSNEWRNVPELSERDRKMLLESWIACMGAQDDECFVDWFSANAARLAREYPRKEGGE